MKSDDSSVFLRYGQRGRSRAAGREARRGQQPVPGEPQPCLSEPGSDARLNSWKEIAAYLRSSVRSVRRWEKEAGLPVRRHVHYKGDSVYALRAELDAWGNNRRFKPRVKASRITG